VEPSRAPPDVPAAPLAALTEARADAPRPGLLVLHGNRLELLAEAVLAWVAAHPLQPLEAETFLVQSHGMGEWLKMEIALAHGVCAATQVELPARFLWRAYRAVLGREAVPAVSALDKQPLTWRLMQLLPECVGQPGFEPVADFLGDGDPARRLQLARRLADLFDQYQVYRSDWLADWSEHVDQLRATTGGGRAAPVPTVQRWQPALWRALLQGLPAEEQAAARPALHERFLRALAGPAPARALPALPRRVVLFGTTHIPHQTLEAIAALSTRCQVLMAVPNPCRYHWADLIDGRELLRAERRRHPLRAGRDLAGVPLQELHAHGHPLLAAWGRQGRDFIRQLDAFDDVQAARQRFDVPRVDLFDEAPAATLLQQVQAAIRDLMPLAEHPRGAVQATDRSIVFHVAHSAQREVEILHDQLLHLFAQRPGEARHDAFAQAPRGRQLDLFTPAPEPAPGATTAPRERPLNPRDVVVMVPDIDAFAPAIRSVFGQHARGQARHIPWGIADLRSRGRQPVLVALEWLLRAPQKRFGASEIRDLLDVPAVARRFGIAPEDGPTLVAWIEGAGIRWGLNAAQRHGLGLGAAGEPNTWAFGLRRMLLGYAAGELVEAGGFNGIEPYAEVAGLSAALAGALAELLQVLSAWWADAGAARTPVAWGVRLRGLVAEVFKAGDEDDRAVLAALDDGLAAWLQACEAAGFEQAVDVAVVREAWLEAVDEPGASARFKAGGVTFCTLLPMRAIPFEVVCLLGMNEGDYPRRSPRSDFDLMAGPGLARPGDRSRRDDDRQLMLDALLSARRVLYVSWAGRSVRDNQVQPPSVLVAQLRDYLAAGWGSAVLEARTTQHPLQPFSRRYFEPGAARQQGGGLVTYASEWRAAHADADAEVGAARRGGPTGACARDHGHGHGPARGRDGADAGDRDPVRHRGGDRDRAGAGDDGAVRVFTIAGLASFLRNPVKEFFRHRLQVSFRDIDASAGDDEVFAHDGLQRWSLLDDVLRATRALAEAGTLRAVPAPDAVAALIERQVARLYRAGRLPLAEPGRHVQEALARTLRPMGARWQAALTEHAEASEKQPLRFVHPAEAGLVLDDVLPALRRAAGDAGGGGGRPVWIDLQASVVAQAGERGAPTLREDKLLVAWVRGLASAACGCPADGLVIGPGAAVRVTPPDRDEAVAVLGDLLRTCEAALAGDMPPPTAVKTGLALLRDPGKARAAFEGNPARGVRGEGQEACLGRLYPDYETLRSQPGFEAATRELYEPFVRWLSEHTDIELLPEPELEPEDDERRGSRGDRRERNGGGGGDDE